MAMFAEFCEVLGSSKFLPWPLLPFCFALFVRISIGLHPYSGMSTPPLFGDYEAQRHWMEITLHTPVQEWYTATENNDLLYWGLDYPPLTAFQSFLHGHFVHFFCPEAVALGSSRGFESPESKLLMRWTVLMSDLGIFFPAALYFVSSFYKASSVGKGMRTWCLCIILLQPGLILIDHGHFQFNCISLGLSMAAAAAIIDRRDLLGSFLFCLAINHKHMSLYFAPAFFGHLLGRCLQSRAPVSKFLSLALVVVSTFILCWLPFLHSPAAALQVLSRLVPLSRGLYEDHVANFWCATSAVVKWKLLFSVPFLARLALGCTVLAALPSCLHQALFPSAHGLLLSLLNSSLAFFMFAFQVHEKSILLPVLPITLLSLHHPRLLRFFVPISTLSMFPLLIRDQLSLAYFSLQLLFLLISPPPPASHQHCIKTPGREFLTKSINFVDKICTEWGTFLSGLCLLLALSLHLGMWFIAPPQQYPYLHPALMVTFSFSLLFPVAIYTNLLQWTSFHEPAANSVHNTLGEPKPKVA